MKKVLKWIGILLGVLIVLVAVVAAAAYARGSAYLAREYDLEVETIEIPSDPESIANGEYLATSLVDCTGCHGENFAGQEMINEEGFLVLYSANLTSGAGGIAASYTDEDWLRSMRHGIRPNGENLLVMPAQHLRQLGAEDIGDIIAFVKTLPPVDHVIPARQVFFMPRLLVGLGMFPPEAVAEIFPASVIDHQNNPFPVPPSKGVTVEWGQYRALFCTGCHAENLAGKPADLQTGQPATPNLTPGGELLVWSVDDFIHTIRTGVTPTGKVLDEAMPWKEFALATDDDLTAIFLYLQSLPALETNN